MSPSARAERQWGRPGLDHGSLRCRSCGAGGMRLFHQVEKVPVHCCQLLPSREAALRAPTAPLHLAFCDVCGFIQNAAFDPLLIDYSADYEDSQAYSPRFKSFARSLAERLIETYQLRNSDILEIGCGKGDFLVLCCELGGNRGIGIDPACQPERVESGVAGRIRFIRDFYSPRYSDLKADLLCCRHTLEHLPQTREFVQMVRESLEDSRHTVVFFEVPDVSRVLEELAFWDLYYEHCSYFSLASLARLFRSCGFDVLRLSKEFGDQYLLIDARASEGSTDERFEGTRDVEELAHLVHRFAEEFPRVIEHWRTRFAALQRERRHTVLWGGGSKAVAFSSTMQLHDEVDYVVDINPHKQGMYLAGTGQQIVAPSFLKQYRPDLVVVMNPIYAGEIRATLEAMGLHPSIVPL